MDITYKKSIREQLIEERKKAVRLGLKIDNIALSLEEWDRLKNEIGDIMNNHGRCDIEYKGDDQYEMYGITLKVK